MGASISVAANTREEFDALQSEGAPEIHLSYGSIQALFDCFGLDDLDCVVGRVQPERILDRVEDAAAAAAGADEVWVLTDEGGRWMNLLAERVTYLAKIAGAAARLGREVTWA